jgi:hypothetical protein
MVDDELVRAIWDRDGHYLIGCEDCLRVFSFPLTPNTVREERWTIRVHCGNLVWFLVAV